MMQLPPRPPPSDAPRKAALHMLKGEAIYRVASTDWTEYKGETLCWRVAAKRRLDGRIETIHFIARRDASDLVSVHVVVVEAKFPSLLEKFQEAIESFVPGLSLRAGELTDFDVVEFGTYFLHDPEAEERMRKKGLLPLPPPSSRPPTPPEA
ncbi:MAG: hypothetical protein K8T20_00315 [Planctomycetes bacterium]|nr:hypothetical protein [Planctomycetota bacterium]